jgi:CBS-domain-containing membrane protein
MIARDIMNRQIHTISPDCSVRDALKRMAALGTQGFPVVDRGQILLGTVNFWQILERAMPSYITKGDLSDVRFAPDFTKLHERLEAIKSNPVTLIMNHQPPCVGPDDSVLSCAALIMQTPKTVYLLPVVEADRRLVGVITAWDLIKEIAT